MTKCPVQKQAHISAQQILHFFFMISTMISPRHVELPPCSVNDFHWGLYNKCHLENINNLNYYRSGECMLRGDLI